MHKMKAWIATDEDSKETWLYTEKPRRGESFFFPRNSTSMSVATIKLPKSPKVVGLDSYPKWEDEPVEVELTLKLRKDMNEKLIETLVKKVEEATGEEVVAVYGHSTRKEILRAQYNSRQGTWRIVKKTGNGHGGWRMFGDSTGYSSKGEAEGKVKKLVERFPNLYMEG